MSNKSFTDSVHTNIHTYMCCYITGKHTWCSGVARVELRGAHALPTKMCAPPTEPAVWKNQTFGIYRLSQANSLLTFHFNLIHLKHATLQLVSHLLFTFTCVVITKLHPPTCVLPHQPLHPGYAPAHIV